MAWQHHDYPKLLEEHYVRRLRDTYRARRERLARIRAAEDARAYIQYVRKAVRQAFGLLPQRTPLNARTLRTSQFDECRIEHVVYESRPGFLVTANLYLPAGQSGPSPAILFACGHDPEGKAYYRSVHACMRLAREGYVVLIWDPIHQGERDVYSLLDTGGRLTRDIPWDGHNVLGHQLQAYGDWLGSWELWDGIRGVDYLASRSEVDPQRLGVTGHSGGGALSAYLWAMEPRIGMVAASCWVTSCLNDLENSLPGDEEQYPPRFLRAGLDKVDFLIARAGDPALLLGQESDFFDDRGLRQAYGELSRLHRLLGGQSSTCGLSLDTGTHEYSDRNQEAMLAFFNRVVGKPPPTTGAPLSLPDERRLQVTPERDANRFGSRPAYLLAAERALAIASARPPISAETLPAAVRRALAVRLPRRAPHHRRRFWGGMAIEGTGRSACRFVMEPEPGILCPLRHVGRSPNECRMTPGPRAILCLPNLGSEEELRGGMSLPDEDDFWMLDVRGLGEGLYCPDDAILLTGRDCTLSSHALMYGETLLGDRVFDVLSAVRLLREAGAQEIHLRGRKQGAVLVLLAALLDPNVATVSSLECPESFLALASAPYTFWPAANFPRGVLRVFDLPEVRAALGSRLVADTRAAPDEFAP